jgi:hypothetical protein
MVSYALVIGDGAGGADSELGRPSMSVKRCFKAGRAVRSVCSGEQRRARLYCSSARQAHRCQSRGIYWIRRTFAPSAAIVVQDAGRRRTGDAGNGAQILVDGSQLVVGHILEQRPRHDLEQVAIERGRQATGRDAVRRCGNRCSRVTRLPDSFPAPPDRGPLCEHEDFA